MACWVMCADQNGYATCSDSTRCILGLHDLISTISARYVASCMDRSGRSTDSADSGQQSINYNLAGAARLPQMCWHPHAPVLLLPCHPHLMRSPSLMHPPLDALHHQYACCQRLCASAATQTCLGGSQHAHQPDRSAEHPDNTCVQQGMNGRAHQGQVWACLPLGVVVRAIGSLHAIAHGLLGGCLLLRCSTYTVTTAL